MAIYVANAKSGPEIPIPMINVVEAIQIADSTLKAIPKEKWIDYNVKEYMILSATYSTDYELRKRTGKSEWFWLIDFVHPKHNDHHFLFKIDNKRKIFLIETTE